MSYSVISLLSFSPLDLNALALELLSGPQSCVFRASPILGAIILTDDNRYVMVPAENLMPLVWLLSLALLLAVLLWRLYNCRLQIRARRANEVVSHDQEKQPPHEIERNAGKESGKPAGKAIDTRQEVTVSVER